ncbi:MAG: hypothetical protein ACSHYA_01690 [Opitutaceae bacterium]
MPSTRFLFSAAVGITIFSIGFIYALYSPKVYRATGIVQVLSELDEPQTLERELDVFRSAKIAHGIDQRLLDEERRQLLLPYQGMKPDDQLSPTSSVLLAFSKFQPIRDSQMIRIRFDHPDPAMAANICNLYMKEFINYWLKTSIDASMRVVEAQRIRCDQLKERVEAAEENLEMMREERSKAAPEQIEALDQKQNELLKTLETERETFKKAVEEMTKQKARVNLTSPRVRIVEQAEIPTVPVSPNIPLWTTLSILAGLLGFGLSFRLTQNTFQTK